MFAAYLVLVAWLVTRVKFFTNSGLSKSQLVILFLLKVMAGIFYGWIGVYYGEMAKMIDTWWYHYESLHETQLLKNDPTEFFSNLFRNSYEGGYTKFLSTHNSWWNDVKANFLIKIMAIFNLLSFGHYYVNVIFYSFITLFGPVAMFRVMKDVFPERRQIVLLTCFLIPSFLYWSSGLHKEGLIFVGLTLMVYHFYFGFKENRFTTTRIFFILFGFLLVLILRNFVIVTLTPPLIAWVLSRRLKWKPVFTFSGIMLIFVIIFFTGKYLSPKLDFPQAVVTRQQEFLRMSGGSTVPVTPLEPTLSSFISNTPHAIAMSMLRPYPSDVRHLLSLAAALEINVILLLFLVFLVWRKGRTRVSAFMLFSIFFSFAILMMAGFTVNNLGAIVRYRSPVLPFLVIPMMALIDWERLRRLVFNDINLKNNISDSAQNP